MNTECERIWRIRMSGEDLSRKVWERNEVGIWYGGWKAEDYNKALSDAPSNPAGYLSALVHHRESVLWFGKMGEKDPTITPNAFATIKRFFEIKESDWVYVYFEGALHFAQITGEVLSEEGHPLNENGKVFKFRRIKEKKKFLLSNLPDCFRLLPSAGRGNIHEVHNTNRELVKILSKAETNAEANEAIRRMPWKEWLAIL